ncbi:MAG: hypothetical protein ACPGVT_08880, partial [Maricaulaceae bacterium]
WILGINPRMTETKKTRNNCYSLRKDMEIPLTRACAPSNQDMSLRNNVSFRWVKRHFGGGVALLPPIHFQTPDF